MKKLNWLLVFFLILSTMFVVGCSDDDNGNGNGPNDPPFDPEDSDYSFTIVSYGERDVFLIYVTNFEGAPITNLSLMIDGLVVEMDNWEGEWMTTYTFNYAQVYNFDMSIANSTVAK